MKANASAAEMDRLSDEEVFGQVAYVLFSLGSGTYSFTHHRSLTFAAMDSSSSALSRVICLLGENPKIQSQLRQELREAKNINNGKELDYDQIINLPFLDAIIRETLRLFVVSFKKASSDTEQMG